MKSNEEETESLEGLGDLLPAEVLSKFNGSIVFNIYIGGALPKQKTHPDPETHPDPPCVGREKGAGELPEVLSTEAAMALWKKAQEAGFVDADYQPLISRTQAALLADAMAMRLGIRNKWKVFETFWGRKYMRSDYNLALTRKQSLDFQDELKQVLG